jgi:hypothetical protein
MHEPTGRCIVGLDRQSISLGNMAIREGRDLSRQALLLTLLCEGSHVSGGKVRNPCTRAVYRVQGGSRGPLCDITHYTLHITQYTNA